MDIVCLAFPAWDGDYAKSTVELMRAAAAEGHRVLYVDYAHTWTDFFKSFFERSAADPARLLGLKKRLRKVEERLFVLSLPPVAPTNFLKSAVLHDAINRANAFLIEKTVRRAMKKLGIERPAVVNAFNPRFGLALRGRLGERRLVYYCYDEISAAAWAARHGERLEKAFSEVCDAVAVSSEGLAEKFGKRGIRPFLIKNGVNFGLFDAASRAVLPEKKGQKTIGYVGSIDDRLDFELLQKLFKKWPAERFLFVGRIQNEAIRARLAAFPNVETIGPRPMAELPKWVAEMDVCLIPFVRNAFTAAIYPMKINEYLAAGKAVVSTRFAPLGEFEGVVDFAETAQEFEDRTALALEKQTENAVFLRKSFAEKNAWAERARQLTEILSEPAAA